MDRPLLVNEFEDLGLSISDDIIDECKYHWYFCIKMDRYHLISNHI